MTRSFLFFSQKMFPPPPPPFFYVIGINLLNSDKLKPSY